MPEAPTLGRLYGPPGGYDIWNGISADAACNGCNCLLGWIPVSDTSATLIGYPACAASLSSLRDPDYGHVSSVCSSIPTSVLTDIDKVYAGRLNECNGVDNPSNPFLTFPVLYATGALQNSDANCLAVPAPAGGWCGGLSPADGTLDTGSSGLVPVGFNCTTSLLIPGGGAESYWFGSGWSTGGNAWGMYRLFVSAVTTPTPYYQIELWNDGFGQPVKKIFDRGSGMLIPGSPHEVPQPTYNPNGLWGYSLDMVCMSNWSAEDLVRMNAANGWSLGVAPP